MVYIYGAWYVPFSNGIKLEYKLAEILNNGGIHTKILCFNEKIYELPSEYKEITIDATKNDFKIKKTDIVIYPESVKDNPLNASRVIRWLLNKPFALTNTGIEYGNLDLVVSYSNFVSENLPQLFVLLDDTPIISKVLSSAKKTNKRVAVYFGKCHESVLTNKIEELANVMQYFESADVITRDIPSTREKTLTALANAELLVSFDPLTSLNHEATLLNTPVLYMDDSYGTSKKAFNVPIKGAFYQWSESNYLEALEEVKESYHYYSEFISNQNDNVVKTFRSIIDMLITIETDSNRQKENAYVNDAIQKEDKKYYCEKQKEEPFVNIYSFSDIPILIRKCLRMNEKSVFIEKITRLLKTKAKQTLRKNETVLDIAKKVYHFKDNLL